MSSICYITCYFDINRSKWQNFARSFDDYLLHFKPFIPLFEKTNAKENHLIVFIDDRYISRLNDEINHTNKETTITLIPINESFLQHNIPCWKNIPQEREIMNSTFFKNIVGNRIIYPECQYPEYTMINHSKIDFICYALNTNLSLLETFCWIDFGFFSKPENIPKRLLDISRFDLNKINYTLINPITPEDSDVSYILKSAPEKIGGFFFLGNREKMYDYQQVYHESLKDYQRMNLCDDDQGVALYTYFKHPELFSFNSQDYGWHKVLVVNQQKKQTKKKVISFCLWGQEQRYVVGLIENIRLAYYYYPDWICYVYIHQKSLTLSLSEKLQSFKNTFVIVKNDEHIIPKRCMLWRIEPLNDPSVELFISRDIDTRILPREVLAVREWLASDKDVHIMRDHPQHYNKILGGMFGVRTAKFAKYNWQNLIENFYAIFGAEENDQHFLEKYIYNMSRLEDKLIHDEIKMYEGGDMCKPFPIKYEKNCRFVGCYVYEDGTGDLLTENVLKNYVLTVMPHRMSEYSITVEEKLKFLKEKIDTIYVIHYTKLVERKKMMTNQLSQHLLDLYFDIQWIENFDREIIPYQDNQHSNIIHRVLTRGETANMMAHEFVLRKIQSGSKKESISLVIEDDCIFKDDFIHHLYQSVVLLSNQNWDMCCLGGPVELNTYPARALDKSTNMTFQSHEIEIFTPSSPAPCTVSSMLYHKNGIEKVLQSQYLREPYQCPSDHALWLANIDTMVDMKWTQPFITYEGSKVDIFKTSFTDRGF